MVENPGHNFRRKLGHNIASHTIGQPIRVRPAPDDDGAWDGAVAAYGFTAADRRS